MTEEKALATQSFTPDRVELIKRTIARGSTNDELALFIAQCERTGLDPFARQIYSIRRKQWNSETRSYEENQVIQVSIDGFRVIADRTNKYAGQDGPYWCGKDGKWTEVWLADTPPAAAKVGVLRHDFKAPVWGIALYASYVQTNKNGEPVSRWKTDPAGMLAKCAESLALRKAFPNDLSGLYTSDEMSNVGEVSQPQPEMKDAIEGNFHAEPSAPLPPTQHAPEPEPQPEPIRVTPHAVDNRAMVTIGKNKWPKDWIDEIKAKTNANPFHIGAMLELINAQPNWVDDVAIGAGIVYLTARNESKDQDTALAEANDYITKCINGQSENG